MRRTTYRLLLAAFTLTFVLVIFGCGTPSETVPVDTETETGNGLPLADDNADDTDDEQIGSPDIEMEIVNFAFSQKTITVPLGTTVIWYNSDPTSHTVTTIDPLFDSGTMSTGETFSYTFEQAGTYEYFCTIHPYMTGTVIVE